MGTWDNRHCWSSSLRDFGAKGGIGGEGWRFGPFGLGVWIRLACTELAFKDGGQLRLRNPNRNPRLCPYIPPNPSARHLLPRVAAGRCGMRSNYSNKWIDPLELRLRKQDCKLYNYLYLNVPMGATCIPHEPKKRCRSTCIFGEALTMGSRNISSDLGAVVSLAQIQKRRQHRMILQTQTGFKPRVQNLPNNLANPDATQQQCSSPSSPQTGPNPLRLRCLCAIHFLQKP